MLWSSCSARSAYTLPQYTPVEPWREQSAGRDPLGQLLAGRPGGDRRRHRPAADRAGRWRTQYLAGEPLQVATVLTGTGTVQTLRRGGASNEVRCAPTGRSTVEFYTFDYPGWQVTVDGLARPHRHAPPYGLVTVDVPAGEHRLVLRMGTTPPRPVGGIASLVAAALIIALVIRPAKRLRALTGLPPAGAHLAAGAASAIIRALCHVPPPLECVNCGAHLSPSDRLCPVRRGGARCTSAAALPQLRHTGGAAGAHLSDV